MRAQAETKVSFIKGVVLSCRNTLKGMLLSGENSLGCDSFSFIADVCGFITTVDK